MTQKFASIELARLYESQGYIEDALTMYKTLDQEDDAKSVEVRASITRLESALAEMDTAPLSDDAGIEKIIAEVNEIDAEPTPGIKTDQETKISKLMDKWLMLMVVQKRVKLFKAIRARL